MVSFGVVCKQWVSGGAGGRQCEYIEFQVVKLLVSGGSGSKQ